MVFSGSEHLTRHVSLSSLFFAILHRFHDYFLIDNPPRHSFASLPSLNHPRPTLIRTHCSCTHTPSYSPLSLPLPSPVAHLLIQTNPITRSMRVRSDYYGPVHSRTHDTFPSPRPNPNPSPSVLLCTSAPSLPLIIHVFVVIYFSHTRPWHIYILTRFQKIHRRMSLCLPTVPNHSLTSPTSGSANTPKPRMQTGPRRMRL
jgi:hypothetical protein